jgi:multidrug efflux pump subunit AcrB
LLANAQIENEEGRLIPVDEVVGIYNSPSPGKIESGKFGPEISFSLNTDSPQDAMAEIKKMLKGSEIQGYFDGEYFRGIAIGREMTVSLLLAFILLYFILAAQFESLVQPFIVLSELIIDLSGVFLLLMLTGHSLNLISGTGIMIMCGIVINDSILKVDMINRLREKGYGLDEAIVKGGKRRFRPIVMTSITTVLSMLPILFSSGMGSKIQYSFALALIGGMMAGTITSLYFIPLAYRMIYTVRGGKK